MYYKALAHPRGFGNPLVDTASYLRYNPYIVKIDYKIYLPRSLANQAVDISAAIPARWLAGHTVQTTRENTTCDPTGFCSSWPFF